MGMGAGGQPDSSIQPGSCCLNHRHVAGGRPHKRRILRSPISAKRDLGRVICLTVTTTLGETRHGTKSMAVQCDTTRYGMLRVKSVCKSRIGWMPQFAASRVARRAHEKTQNRLRNGHSALAACRSVRSCLRHRIAYLDRSAGTKLDQFVRCGSTPECVGDAYAG